MITLDASTLGAIGTLLTGVAAIGTLLTGLASLIWKERRRRK